jgi:hypothetical protein
MDGAGVADDEIDQITWQNTCRFFRHDPFAHVAKVDASVGALRARSLDVDTSVRSRKEWADLYALRAAS